MKWLSTSKDDSYYNKRNRRRFLFLPLTIKGETRWLEMAEWQETFHYGYFSDNWVKDWWIDAKTKKL